MFSGILFVIIGVIVGIESLPKIEAPCGNSDTVCITKISNQLFKVAIQGDLAHNVVVLDPMKADVIEGKLATLTYTLLNSTIVGFKNCYVEKSTLSDNESVLGFVNRCPLLKVNGNYEVKGDLLSLPIVGNGPFDLLCKDYIVSFEGKLKRIKDSDGKEHIQFKNFQVTGDLLGGMDFHMHNLFNGQKELSDAIHKVINDNWKEVVGILQPPILKAGVKEIIKNLNTILKEIPVDDMYLPNNP